MAVPREQLQSFVVGNHFYITDDQSSNTPSRQDGISEGVERRLRSCEYTSRPSGARVRQTVSDRLLVLTDAGELMQEATILLKLPQVCYSTGSVLFHRFFSRHSLKKYNVRLYAMVSTQAICCCLCFLGLF